MIGADEYKTKKIVHVKVHQGGKDRQKVSRCHAGHAGERVRRRLGEVGRTSRLVENKNSERHLVVLTIPGTCHVLWETE